jgi:hypothetical protein
MKLALPPFASDVCAVAGTPLASRMLGTTWRPDAPVPLEELRLLRVHHVGFDGKSHGGEIIVHQAIAPATLRIFQILYENQFPIEKMKLLHHYDGDDEASMADNNSSAFNARPLTGHASGWSKHSYGVAIDINPVINPYAMAHGCLPPAGSRYLDRTQEAPGLIRPGTLCHTLFVQQGFEWGGDWTHVRDYHHFELPLRVIGYDTPSV